MVNIALGGKGSFEDFYPGDRIVNEEDKPKKLTGKALNDFIKGAF